MTHNIRQATAADSAKILEIYAPFITDTVITFETELPTAQEFYVRVKEISERYPFLVYEIDNKILGYAYAAKHRERAAYMYNVEVSVYISPKHHGAGIADKLYTRLFELLDKLGYKNAYAVYNEPNEKSRKFHQKFGFEYVGTFRKTGYKFGKWHDVTWLEMAIGEHGENPKKIVSINEVVRVTFPV
ncbi:MAG: N-acetyltransferase family protein [Defluviitaleaceae bacterium]|nr:N-acetyltransferase family protein [Defluviitaleaceae bacterium]